MVNKFVERKYKEVSKLIEPNSSILDIGCDTGELINFFQNKDYVGIDIDKKKIKELKKKGIKVFLKDLNKDNLPVGQKFDYITFLDILEHLVDPADAINKCKKILNKEGKLIICLPNDYHFLNKIRFLLNRKISKYPFWAHGHLHTFPIKEGERFLKEQGLIIQKRVVLYPSKPKILPNFIKKCLANISPNNFSRGILYLTKF